MKVLITGANGFVGSALTQDLLRRNHQVVAAVRQHSPPVSMVSDERLHWVVTSALDGQSDWTHALRDVDVVIHLAARVHVVTETVNDALAAFRVVNVEGTLNLAGQAAQQGIKRFVFVSSVKVNGEATMPGHAFSETDVPHPGDAYGTSKYEAEMGLLDLSGSSAMTITMVRPPLVYGPHAKANFAALMRAVHHQWPLPLGAISNRRSLLALENLTDFLACCAENPLAANQTFLVSDGHDLSTVDLVRELASALGVQPRLFPVPVWLLKIGAACLGKSAAMDRLCGNLQVDSSKAGKLLGWTPPISVAEGLRRAVGGFDTA